MGKFSKDKGVRVERSFVNKLKAAGIAAQRVPLSGAMDNYKGDITLPWLHESINAEVKGRADGFKEIYKWIKPHKLLFLKADNQDGLAVMRVGDFADLLRQANRPCCMKPIDL